MDLQLVDAHVLITGGSKGIGLAVARAFLSEGARVTLVARERSTLESARSTLTEEPSAQDDDSGREAGSQAGPSRGRTAGEGSGQRIAIHSADLRDPASALSALDAAEAELGPVDILVNSAGAARRYGPAELTPERWRDAMDAKYFTYIHMLDPTIKRMAKRRRGSIVNVIGAGGKLASTTHLSGGAANAALMLATAGLARAYAAEGIRVNAVNPGLTETERLIEGLQAEARQDGISLEAARQRAGQRMPLGRIASPDEIAHAVVFLASPKASYVSGAILAMDGALTPMVV